MYKIIDKIPDNIFLKDIQERYIYAIYHLPLHVFELRRIGDSEEVAIKNINKYFSHIPFTIGFEKGDIIKVLDSNLSIQTPFYFIHPKKGVEYLYDEINHQYIHITYLLCM